MTSTTEEALLEMFNKYSNNGVEKVKKIDDYAFVHFQLREQAELAMRTLDQTEIDGSKVEITWAKPVDKDVYKTKKAIAKSFNASRMQMQGRQIKFIIIHGINLTYFVLFYRPSRLWSPIWRL